MAVIMYIIPLRFETRRRFLCSEHSSLYKGLFSLPIKIPDSLPARAVLESENIFVMTEHRATTQRIRPLRIAILNLMPLKIVTDDGEYLDTAELDAVGMAQTLRSYKGKTGTSCPNVADWLAAYEGAEEVFVVTITGTLSGSYNAAQLAAEGARPDVIVVDPPRKGCDEATLTAIAEMAPRTVVMVSCNAATAARDTRWLVEHGYKAEEVQPVDLFPRTKHVECVVKLERM